MNSTFRCFSDVDSGAISLESKECRDFEDVLRLYKENARATAHPDA